MNHEHKSGKKLQTKNSTQKFPNLGYYVVHPGAQPQNHTWSQRII